MAGYVLLLLVVLDVALSASSPPKARDAVASGSVVVDGVTLVSGTTPNAEIETLEDRNRTLP